MSENERTATEVAKPRWLTITQLMEVVPLKRSRIYYLTHVGSIPHHKIGQTLLFREDEIMAWLDRNKVA